MNILVDFDLMSHIRICETNKIFLYVKKQVLIMDMCGNTIHLNVETAHLNIGLNNLERSIKHSRACWQGPLVVLNVLSGVI